MYGKQFYFEKTTSKAKQKQIQGPLAYIILVDNAPTYANLDVLLM